METRPQTSGGASTNCSGRFAWPWCLMTATLPPSGLRWTSMVRCGTGSHSSGLQRRPGYLVRGWSWDRSESTCPAHRIVQGFGSIQGPVIRDKGGLLSQRFAGHSDPPGSRKGFPWRRTSWALAKPPISLQLERPSAGVAIVEGLLSPAVAPIPRPPLCSLLLDPLRPPRPLLAATADGSSPGGRSAAMQGPSSC